MGTYPDLPSYVLETGEDLQKVIDKHATELFGKNTIQKFGHTNLPYLPKVLSIAKALPLQLHPVRFPILATRLLQLTHAQDKSLAAKLHEKDPSNFTDPNHKPEIALALTKFEAFCGFKPLSTIEKLTQLEPLRRFLPSVNKPAFDDQTLKHVVKTMLEASESTVASTASALQQLPRDAFGDDTYIPDLLPRLQAQYDKTDPGTLVALITMNYLVLQPGESIYIPADGIHAYLAGDIIECMARSNNVLNSGFCPRAERNSIDTFCSCLTFTPHAADEAMLRPKPFDRASQGKTKLYAPPMSEFNMLATELGRGEKESIGKLHGPSILLVSKGKGTMRAEGKEFELSEGFIFFVAADTGTEFEAAEGLQMFRAYVE